MDEYEAPRPCLMEGDYCSETTEDFGASPVPYSMRLLMEQTRREKNLKNKKKKNEPIERN